MKKQETMKLTEDYLIELYITQNLTVADIAKQCEVGTTTVNRYLKKYSITKNEDQRRAAISKTKQAKTDEEKELYSKHISEARKGKGLGIEPWNKGKKGLQEAWNKGKTMSEDFKIKIKTGINKMTAEQKTQQKLNLSESLTGRTPWNLNRPYTEEEKENFKKKLEKTCLKKYGKTSFAKTPEYLEKRYNTHRKNKSFKSSAPEQNYKLYLENKYGAEDVCYQYSTDPRYPFNCDFYIKSLDLFIELNIHWTHGGHLYDPQNPADVEKLATWEEKALTSDFYKNAIETWTLRDVEKHTWAIKNNLNYKVIYKEEDLFSE